MPAKMKLSPSLIVLLSLYVIWYFKLFVFKSIVCKHIKKLLKTDLVKLIVVNGKLVQQNPRNVKLFQMEVFVYCDTGAYKSQSIVLSSPADYILKINKCSNLLFPPSCISRSSPEAAAGPLV